MGYRDFRLPGSLCLVAVTESMTVRPSPHEQLSQRCFCSRPGARAPARVHGRRRPPFLDASGDAAHRDPRAEDPEPVAGFNDDRRVHHAFDVRTTALGRRTRQPRADARERGADAGERRHFERRFDDHVPHARQREVERRRSGGRRGRALVVERDHEPEQQLGIAARVRRRPFDRYAGCAYGGRPSQRAVRAVRQHVLRRKRPAVHGRAGARTLEVSRHQPTSRSTANRR